MQQLPALAVDLEAGAEELLDGANATAMGVVEVGDLAVVRAGQAVGAIELEVGVRFEQPAFKATPKDRRRVDRRDALSEVGTQAKAPRNSGSQASKPAERGALMFEADSLWIDG